MPDVYKDRNGATWLIVTTAAAIFATPDPDGVVGYSPQPPDVGPVSAQKGDSVGKRERDKLIALIEAWAAKNKSSVVLVVTAKPDGGAGWVLVLLGLWILSES